MQEDTLKQFLPATERWFRKTFGEPTKIQREAWPAIADGKHVLVSAPTGTGKTLSAFLVFIDQLGGLAERGELKEELYVIYVSPLKSLAGDIRENLRKPLEGIGAEAPGESKAESRPGNPFIGQIQAAIRTGDTPQKERQRMVKTSAPHPDYHSGIPLSHADIQIRPTGVKDCKGNYFGRASRPHRHQEGGASDAVSGQAG